MLRTERLRRFTSVVAELDTIDDDAMTALLDAAEPLGSGIGGATYRLEFGGIPVFAKRITLTDVELEASRRQSTADPFDLPHFCHYGIGRIGSPGFGAWREVAAHELTTNWVLDGKTHAFPLLYHRRILSGAAQLPEELRDVDAAVRSWHDSAAVRERIEALKAARQAVWVFLEFVPQTLETWLVDRKAAGTRELDAAAGFVERELQGAVDFMSAHGFVHFDAHFDNVLTDGDQLYFADLGLAVSAGFDLTAGERDFVERHVHYDRSYVFTYLVRWLIGAFEGAGTPVTAYTRAEAAAVFPPHSARIVHKYGPLGSVMMQFYLKLQDGDRETAYPVALERQFWESDAPRAE